MRCDARTRIGESQEASSMKDLVRRMTRGWSMADLIEGKRTGVTGKAEGEANDIIEAAIGESSGIAGEKGNFNEVMGRARKRIGDESERITAGRFENGKVSRTGRNGERMRVMDRADTIRDGEVIEKG